MAIVRTLTHVLILFFVPGLLKQLERPFAKPAARVNDTLLGTITVRMDKKDFPDPQTLLEKGEIVRNYGL